MDNNYGEFQSLRPSILGGVSIISKLCLTIQDMPGSFYRIGFLLFRSISSHSMYQVSQNGLDIIGFLIDRLASDFKPYLNTVLTSIVDR